MSSIVYFIRNTQACIITSHYIAYYIRDGDEHNGDEQDISEHRTMS